MSCFPCRVAKVQQHIGNTLEIELGNFIWQFDAPAADRPGIFERQVALVLQIDVERLSSPPSLRAYCSPASEDTRTLLRSNESLQ